MKISEKETKIFVQVSDLLKDTIACQYVEHTKKVINYCRKLGAIEGANMKLLIPAAILHDVGRCKDNSLLGHVEKGIPIARRILTECDYKEEQINLILQVIAEHHADLPEMIPSSIEGRVLLDADRLEIVGEYGMARWLLCSDNTISPQKACQLWLNLSLRKAPNRKTFFCTDAGEEMGNQGFEFCEMFCRGIIHDSSF